MNPDMNPDLIKWHQREIARQERQIEHNRLIFWAVWVVVGAFGIGYGVGRWPDVVARIFTGWTQ